MGSTTMGSTTMRFSLRALTGVLTFSTLALTWGQTPSQSPPVSQSLARAPDRSAGVLFGSGDDYLLGAGDVVNVSIYADPELSRDCRISSDGYIVMPLLNDKLKAAGKTAEQLQNAISEAYKAHNILKNPQATVSVKEFHSSPVSLMGAVGRSTTIQVQGHVTLFEAITMADGFAKDAGTKITVTRKATVTPEGQTIPGETLVIARHALEDKTNDPAVNISLQGGDIVVVSRAEFIYIGGAVSKR